MVPTTLAIGALNSIWAIFTRVKTMIDGMPVPVLMRPDGSGIMTHATVWMDVLGLMVQLTCRRFFLAQPY